MHADLTRIACLILAALALGSAATAHAGTELLDVDARFRAKIAKEKVRAAAQQRQADEEQQRLLEEEEKSFDGSGCGSQSIGNIDTGGRPGTAPREEFVFAPGAINIVARGGCG